MGRTGREAQYAYGDETTETLSQFFSEHLYSVPEPRENCVVSHCPVLNRALTTQNPSAWRCIRCRSGCGVCARPWLLASPGGLRGATLGIGPLSRPNWFFTASKKYWRKPNAWAETGKLTASTTINMKNFRFIVPRPATRVVHCRIIRRILSTSKKGVQNPRSHARLFNGFLRLRWQRDQRWWAAGEGRRTRHCIMGRYSLRECRCNTGEVPDSLLLERHERFIQGRSGPLG